MSCSTLGRSVRPIILGLCLAVAAGAAETDATPPALAAGTAPGAHGWNYEELRRFPAVEAKQGAASDGEFVYVISDRAIGKYRAETGQRVATWSDEAGGPFIHLNAGIVRDGKLICAHSNYPGVPMLSSVEIWDAATLRHIGTHSFGRSDGSLTWLDRRDGRWIACFVHYGKKGGEPGRGVEWTQIVEFDDDWRRTGGWALPAELIARLSPRGYSCSGGAIGPDGRLYVTGHDAPELYVLEFPSAGPVLRWIATVPVTAEGQAFGWNPRDRGTIYFIRRPGDLIVGRMQLPGQ